MKRIIALALALLCAFSLVSCYHGYYQQKPEKVEGATKWEEFWYITLPMIGQTLLLVIVFTLIEVLTQNSNAVITQAYNQMISNMNYSDSAAMLWTFFGIVGGATGIIILLYSKLCLKRWE